MTAANKTIAYQGLEGAYSHLACRHVFPEMTAIACPSFAEAMYKVERGEAQLAMIPMDNSTAGRVEEMYRLMPKTNLYMVGEHFEAINHCLLGLKGTKLQDIKTVTSHPQALAQCQKNIQALNIEAIAGYDTAGLAAEIAQGEDGSRAAIASSLAAELYQLDILKQNFQDVSGNTTRFLILAKEAGLPEYQKNEAFITSLLFTVRNIPAALFKALGGFATNGINMVKLESYMGSGLPTASSFHLDVEGHPEQRSMQHALEELAFFSDEFRIMGTYKAHAFRAQNKPLPE